MIDRLAAGEKANVQKRKPKASVERMFITYQGKPVCARKLTVSSELPIDIATAWENVKTPALLQFVARGMITFRSTEGVFPASWEVGQTYGVNMRIFGWIPFGGIHYLRIKRIDKESYELATQEWDKRAKVWNHTIVLKDLGHGKTYYEDTIIIYGGMLTSLITAFAKRFYQHRQKRWQIVAREHLAQGKRRKPHALCLRCIDVFKC